MRTFLIVLALYSAASLSGCSTPTAGPDKSLGGAILGAGWGAGAGAVVGNQVATTGQGMGVGAGIGAAEGLLVGLLRPSILLGCMRRGWPLAGILNSP